MENTNLTMGFQDIPGLFSLGDHEAQIISSKAPTHSPSTRQQLSERDFFTCSAIVTPCRTKERPHKGDTDRMVAHTEWSGVNSIGVPAIKNVATPALRAPRPRATALITSIIRMADLSNSGSAASIRRRRPGSERTEET